MKKTSTVQLVHNAILKIRYAGHAMLIDPILADKSILTPAFDVNRTPRVHLTTPTQDIIGGMDMVPLAHSHIDHYEPSVPTYLPKKTPFYVQPQDADAVRNDGFTNMIPIKEIKTTDGMSVYRTTGHHSLGQIGQIMGPVSSHVLRAEDFPIVYIMGDCRREACIRDTAKRFNPDYIVVNSGGAIFPGFPKTDGPIIPDENEVMQILDRSPSHIKLMVVHMDAIGHCQTTRTILRSEAAYYKIDMNRLIILEDGETVVL